MRGLFGPTWMDVFYGFKIVLTELKLGIPGVKVAALAEVELNFPTKEYNSIFSLYFEFVLKISHRKD